MSTSVKEKSDPVDPAREHYDAVVIGAGFGGLYMLHKLRNEMGLNVRAFDRAKDVGGTWYWNRYPGALSDSESMVYRFSFDKDLLNDWKWDTRYLKQPQVLAYLQHVTDRFDLRRSVEFETGIAAAHYDEASARWFVTTDDGLEFTAQHLVAAVGPLAATNIPDIKGLETFAGETFHTSKWPEQVDLGGKRVGVVGTGSTGIQLITAIAGEVKHLTVFQRTPQYSVPVGNGPVSDDYLRNIYDNWDELWTNVRGSAFAMGFKESSIAAMSVSEAEREAIFQKAWDVGGGFRYAFETFADILIDPEANHAAAAFIRRKIAEIVKDPETARVLTPTDFYVKRPLCDSGYFEVFNRDDVSLVDVKTTPIVEITPDGVVLSDGTVHELDVLVFATGFDAVDGNFKKIDMRGKSGVTLVDHWSKGAASYLGICTAGFPNMYMIAGPLMPFSNFPPLLEIQVQVIADLIEHTRATNADSIEATQAAEDAWVQTCSDLAGHMLLTRADSWIFGANIPGKPKRVLFYVAGVANFLNVVAEMKADGFAGFELSRARDVAKIAAHV
jgi:cyclohexanone monooxygenase